MTRPMSTAEIVPRMIPQKTASTPVAFWNACVKSLNGLLMAYTSQKNWRPWKESPGFLLGLLRLPGRKESVHKDQKDGHSDEHWNQRNEHWPDCGVARIVVRECRTE